MSKESSGTKVLHETRCLMVPMTGDSLLVPNSLVVEITNYRTPDEVKSPAQDWLLGTVRWRNLDVPVVSYEKMIGGEFHDRGQRRRIIICHSFADGELRFIGIVSQGLPRLVSVDEDAVTVLKPAKAKNKNLIYSHISVSDNPAFVPAMKEVGNLVAKAS